MEPKIDHEVWDSNKISMVWFFAFNALCKCWIVAAFDSISWIRLQVSRIKTIIFQEEKHTHIIESQLLFSVDLMKKQVSPFQRMTRTVCARIPPEKRSLCKWVMLPRSSPAVRSMMALMAMAFRTAWRVVLQNEWVGIEHLGLNEQSAIKRHIAPCVSMI